MNILLKTGVAVMVACAFIACESQLATSPYDSIDASAAFQNVTDLNSGALGAYGTITGSNIYDVNALMTDNLRRAASNTGQGMQLFNHNVVAGDNTANQVWNNAYAVIDRINRVLTAAESIQPQNSTEAELKNRLIGEMLGLRAYQHFDLFRVFASYDLADNDLAVPYMVTSGIGSPARATKGEFFTQLLADINESITILTPFGFYNNARMNVHAANGLRARVALYRQDWPTAIDYATRVINAVNLTSRANYPGLWNDSVQGEVIFKLRRITVSDGRVELSERATNDDIFFFASNDLASKYNETDDIRFSEFFQRIDPTTVRVMKYNKRPGEKNLVDIKMMRVSELYFIRAEAYAQPGSQQNLASAAADINSVRAVRYENPPTASFGSSDVALEAIHEERRLELAFEGHRFFDLKRAGLPVQRIPADIDGSTTSDNLPAGSFMFVFPIPQAEVFANGNMVQNPGY
jgi:starch-binding outer membrane protein, SusD/RagB family